MPFAIADPLVRLEEFWPARRCLALSQTRNDFQCPVGDGEEREKHRQFWNADFPYSCIVFTVFDRISIEQAQRSALSFFEIAVQLRGITRPDPKPRPEGLRSAPWPGPKRFWKRPHDGSSLGNCGVRCEKGSYMCWRMCSKHYDFMCTCTHTCMLYIYIYYILAMGAAGRLGVLLLLFVCLFVCLLACSFVFFFDDGVGWGGVGWDVNVHVTLMMLRWSWGGVGWDVNVHVTLMILCWSWGGVGWEVNVHVTLLMLRWSWGGVGWDVNVHVTGGMLTFMLRSWC